MVANPEDRFSRDEAQLWYGAGLSRTLSILILVTLTTTIPEKGWSVKEEEKLHKQSDD